MSIAIREFEIAMNIFGAKKLCDRQIRYNLIVPCYEVNGVQLIHSGTDFVTYNGTEFSKEIMKRAKFKLGKRKNDIINLDEIRSIYGLFLFSLLLENNYDETILKNLLNTTFWNILKISRFSNLHVPQYTHSTISKMNELNNLIKQFDNTVNPFTDDFSKIREPYSCLDEISFEFLFNSDTYPLPNTGFVLSNSKATTEFMCSKDCLLYYADYLANESNCSYMDYISVTHYYNGYAADETISFNICSNANLAKRSLCINLRKGLAWEKSRFKNSDNEPVTDSQIDYMIENLTVAISRIKKAITNKVII